MSSLARWCFRRRFTVLGIWLAALIVLGGIGAAAGSQYTDEFSLPGTESTRALELLEKSFPTQSGDTAQIVWQASDVKDPATQQQVDALLAQVRKIPHIVEVKQGATSKDGTIAYANVNFDKLFQDVPISSYHKLIDAADAANGKGLRVELGGNGIQQAQQAEGGGG